MHKVEVFTTADIAEVGSIKNLAVARSWVLRKLRDYPSAAPIAARVQATNTIPSILAIMTDNSERSHG